MRGMVDLPGGPLLSGAAGSVKGAAGQRPWRIAAMQQRQGLSVAPPPVEG
jgi:hypothetical protein